MKMRKSLIIFALIPVLLSSCSGGTKIAIGIQRHTSPGLSDLGKLDVFPDYTNLTDLNPFQIDLRCRDITGLDLSDKFEALLYSDFDSNTQWPEILPEGFNPEQIIELGKDPGLHVRDLHEAGIDGSGVSIAIIDQTLYTEHSEYADQLKYYEEIPASSQKYAMHGNAVASLAVGKTVGVAPKSNLYFIASEPADADNNPTYEYYAKSINKILDINKQLPDGQKIRAITIAWSWNPDYKGYDEIKKAVARAKDEGVFIISTALSDDYGFDFAGLDRDPLKDPNDINSYSVGCFMKKNAIFFKNSLFFPMDSRTFASWAGADDYEWERIGGFSWVVPYITGLYALGAQVYPEITPEIF